MSNLERNEAVICIIGLGYVGLPLAKTFSKSFKTIGFDTNAQKVNQLNQQTIPTNLTMTTEPKEIMKADFVIICVPTPVTKSKEPDLSFVTSAAKIVSHNMKKGATVIMESTVYPGVTEDIVKPILEKSGLKCGRDFKLAYSPERINPGDSEHTIDRIIKVVSGMDEETTELVTELYSKVPPTSLKLKI
jgi:UDPglucose 6-dehydrogenase/UDP-N-acetyl-D-galactosamine dehydrogenase